MKLTPSAPHHPTPGEMPVPPPLLAALEAALAPGERLVWSGQPQPNRYRRRSWMALGVGIPWTAFSLIWTTLAFVSVQEMPAGNPHRWLFPLFGVSFLLIGLALLSSPWRGRRKAVRVLYAITDRRALIFEPNWRGGRRTQSIERAAMESPERMENPDGSGDLFFSWQVWRDSEGDERVTPIGFVGVPRLYEAETHLRKLMGPTNPAPVGPS